MEFVVVALAVACAVFSGVAFVVVTRRQRRLAAAKQTLREVAWATNELLLAHKALVAESERERQRMAQVQRADVAAALSPLVAALDDVVSAAPPTLAPGLSLVTKQLSQQLQQLQQPQQPQPQPPQPPQPPRLDDVSTG